jgi:FMN hydrolase / 5-amino-6-(5-phospho-D-ribitylamino)uracil phosphatase
MPRYHRPMQSVPRAITLDLDDTLWPIAPVIERAEVALHDWMLAHAPNTAARYPVAAMRALRDAVALANPQLAHDFTAQRKLSLARALTDGGHDPELAEAAFTAFHIARNRVELYPDVERALTRLAAYAPLAALTNGNADLGQIGLHHHFVFALGAREHGSGKPEAGIFHAACTRLGSAPHETLHVGDDPELDVLGAARAGLRTCWINRGSETWTHAELRPDLIFDNLDALADWLDARTQVRKQGRLRSTA